MLYSTLEICLKKGFQLESIQYTWGKFNGQQNIIGWLEIILIKKENSRIISVYKGLPQQGAVVIKLILLDSFVLLH